MYTIWASIVHSVTPGVRTAQTHLAINPAASITIFLVFFFGMWCATSLLTGKMSGWATLGRRFSSTLPFPSQTWHWKSARMRWGANYKSCLTVGADPAGLYLSPLFFFRIGHPALFLSLGRKSHSVVAGKSCLSNSSNSSWVGKSTFPS